MTDPRQSGERKGLFALIADVPRLIGDLVRAEIQAAKDEIAGKLKAAGIGAGLLVGAGLFALLALIVLLFAAVLGLATVMPAWAAALIVGGALLLIAVLVALIGIAALKRGVPPMPTDTMDSVKEDVRAVRGLRK
ncbi:phage holin family protein [Microcella daejeonensis]|uniref:Phage holin family protein n=1 Tax=Microcella daejeonensis TaxID=2994971 RepID=A0A9E8MMK3_9MICO|nr:phage holin family protein [Microcella daejeonensis]WAB82405.1 phage holin family protein [Microcella daejeonensis]